jgi:hypothetical protein
MLPFEMPSQLSHVRRLVGDITPRQYRHVDVALANDLGVFTPMSGPCDYARSPAHTHPAYSFVLSFDGATRMILDGRVFLSRPGELSGVDPNVAHQELPGEGPPFHNPGKAPGDGRMVRVSGVAERVHDAGLETRLIQERAWLKDMVAAQASGQLFLFRIAHGEIRDWTMATNLREREQIPIRF